MPWRWLARLRYSRKIAISSAWQWLSMRLLGRPLLLAVLSLRLSTASRVPFGTTIEHGAQMSRLCLAFFAPASIPRFGPCLPLPRCSSISHLLHRTISWPTIFSYSYQTSDLVLRSSDCGPVPSHFRGLRVNVRLSMYYRSFFFLFLIAFDRLFSLFGHHHHRPPTLSRIVFMYLVPKPFPPNLLALVRRLA
ncbi:hypothetical protein BKA70DRAFT_35754 [Coprinopsis sp. MPI-PUGE-AT-0042]|nr:hypothetical protein BKA70DRAFT_35754 [Coprinopsis sp. MPI-PUGE-AT-0042]